MPKAASPKSAAASSTVSLLAVGLGNPGKQYAGTRHNVGAMLLERVASILGGFSVWERSRDGAIVSSGEFGGVEAMLIRPLAFMNISGSCVAKIASKSSLPPSRILVCHDDLDLELGKIKIKFGG